MPKPERQDADTTAQEIIAETLERCAKARLADGTPAFSPYLLALADWHLARAARDCQALDEYEENQDAFFLTRLLSGIHAADSIRAIHALVSYPIDQRAGRQIKAAFKKSADKGKAALALHHLRELVRDQFSPSQALPGIATQITERVKAGDVEFFERLGSELEKMRQHPEKYQRNMEVWIRRAWLPLCLWQCKSSADAWPLMKRAAKLIDLENEALAIDSDAKRWKAFDAAWRNVRVR